MKSAAEMQAQLVEKSMSDSEFRNTLIADPKAVISEELGIPIPDGVNIHVHESDFQNVHIALPPSSEISEEMLEQISAGVSAASSW